MTAVTMHHFSGLAAPFVRSKGTVSGGVFNMLGIDFYKLPPDEQKILKRILSKAPNIKNSPFNFRRKRK